jgi:hypothetical protein
MRRAPWRTLQRAGSTLVWTQASTRVSRRQARVPAPRNGSAQIPRLQEFGDSSRHLRRDKSRSSKQDSLRHEAHSVDSNVATFVSRAPLPLPRRHQQQSSGANPRCPGDVPLSRQPHPALAPRAASDSLASPAEPAVSAPTPARCPHCRRGQLILIQVRRAEKKLPPSARRGCLLIATRLGAARCAARARARQCLPPRFPGTPAGPSPPFFSRPGPTAASVTGRATCHTGQKSTPLCSPKAPNPR